MDELSLTFLARLSCPAACADHDLRLLAMAVTVIITVAPVPTVVTNGIAVIDIPQ